jgi:transposase-like protein
MLGLESKITDSGTEKQYINELPENATMASEISHGRKLHFTETEVKQIIQGYTEQQLTVYQLAEKHGCHRNTISKLLKQNAVQVANRRMSDEQIAKAVELYQSGQSLREIAKELEFCKSNIQRALHKAGVRMRPAKRQARR